LIVSSVRRHFPGATTLLDIGCGTGFVLAGLREALPALRLTGSEPSAERLSVARRRLPDVELVELDVLEPPPRAFDVVGAFDVLEHVNDDERAVAGLFATTAPGGGLLVLVPQHPWLWSGADVFARHVRRYTRHELVQKLERAGFRVVTATSFVTTLLPAMMVVRTLRGRALTMRELGSQLVPPRPLNVLFEQVLEGERRLIEMGVSLPVGGSLLVVAKRDRETPPRPSTRRSDRR
jgi:SAM-dependent methyltransferase